MSITSALTSQNVGPGTAGEPTRAAAFFAARLDFQTDVSDVRAGLLAPTPGFVLIDSRHPPQAIDLEFVHWLLEESVSFALVFSKADLVKVGLLQKHIELFQEKIAAWCGELPRIFTTSAETRTGRRELLAFIGEALAGVGSFA